MADIRQFRRAVSILKKKGLLSGTGKAGFKLDARSVTPNTRFRGQKLSTLVNKYDDVVSGKVTPVKVPARSLAKFRRKYSTAEGRVLVPHGAGQKATLEGDNIAIIDASGIVRVQIPVEYHNIRQYLRDIKRDHKTINKMKRDNEYFGIRFYGNHRGNFYRDIEDLITDLEKYESVVNSTSKISQEEIFENLEIVRIGVRATRKWEASETTGKSKASTTKENKRYKRYRRNLGRRSIRVQNAYRDAAANRQAEYRARLKRTNPTKFKQLASKRKKDAKKWRKKNSPLKGKK